MSNNQIPIPPENLRTRVTGSKDEKWFLESGGKTLDEWERALRALNFEIKDFNTIVDFGCGCGRALRHLAQRIENNQRLIGLDTDAEAIKWINANIPSVKAYALKDRPPCKSIATGSINLVLSHSVFTHLPEDIQFEWLGELHRILADDGIAVVSFHGDKAIQDYYDSIIISGHDENAQCFMRDIQEKGFVYGKFKNEFEADLVEYYGSAFHDISYIEENWGKLFEIRAWFQSFALGFQDVLVLSKKPTYPHYFIPFKRAKNEKDNSKMLRHLKMNVPHLEQVSLLTDLSNVEDTTQELKYALGYLYTNGQIEAYRQLGSNRKVIGGFLVFIRKILRKIFKFYVEPITEDISNYNLHLTRVLELMIQAINDRDKEIKSLKLELKKD